MVVKSSGPRLLRHSVLGDRVANSLHTPNSLSGHSLCLIISRAKRLQWLYFAEHAPQHGGSPLALPRSSLCPLARFLPLHPAPAFWSGERGLAELEYSSLCWH